MDDLILASLQRELDDDERARLDAWCRASPANAARLEELTLLWTLSARSDPLARLAPPAPSIESITSGTSRRRSATSHRSWGRRVAAGAGLLAAAGLAAVAIYRATPAPSVAPSFAATEFVTDTVESVTARLDDGSVIRLAPQSRLRVTPSNVKREVWLDGEAFFAVAKDKARPFTVRTRAGQVEVLGTRFDLRVERDGLRLVVTEGQVALSNGDERELVRAGQLARLERGTIEVRDAGAPDEYLAWMRGFLVFQDTPLSQVARELEDRFGIKVLLPDSALARRTVTAWFTTQETEQVLTAICRVVDAHCTLRDGVASIEP